MRKTAVMAAMLATMMAGAMGGTPRVASAGSPPGGTGAAIVRTALSYVGYPFTRTGTNPQTGFSDLGFVRYVYRQNGIRLHVHVAPTTSVYRHVLADGPRIKMADLQPGDIVFFKNTVWAGLSHVGIYVGNGTFVHAEWYMRGVRVSSFTGDQLDGNYWATKYQAANRPAPGG